MRIFRKLLILLHQKIIFRCTHAHAKADILQGDVDGEQVKWCEECGAFSRRWRGTDGEMKQDHWRMPMPIYYYDRT